MSTPKKCRSYPEECFVILEAMKNSPKTPLVLPFQTIQKARKFQLMFNSFKRLGMTEEEGLTSMYPEISAITVRLVKDPLSLVVEHNSYTDVSISILKAVAQREAQLNAGD